MVVCHRGPHHTILQPLLLTSSAMSARSVDRVTEFASSVKPADKRC